MKHKKHLIQCIALISITLVILSSFVFADVGDPIIADGYVLYERSFLNFFKIDGKQVCLVSMWEEPEHLTTVTGFGYLRAAFKDDGLYVYLEQIGNYPVFVEKPFYVKELGSEGLVINPDGSFEPLVSSPTFLNDNEKEIKIASFNIQVFGKSKRQKKEVMDILVKTVRNFDIVAIQEFRDVTESTIPYFLDAINSVNGDKYSYIASPRLGRSNQKENYAFYYNTRKIRYKNKQYVYIDQEDVFEREPHIASFQAGNFNFTLVNIHTKPTDARREIQELEEVFEDTVINLKARGEVEPEEIDDIIILGDYNADGSYFSESITTGFRAKKYKWAIPDSADTTVASSSKTYDRIVFRDSWTSEEHTGKWGVFNFTEIYDLTMDFTKKVSDHYPVYATFSIK